MFIASAKNRFGNSMRDKEFYHSRVREARGTYYRPPTISWEEITQWDLVKYVRGLGVQDSGLTVLSQLVRGTHKLGVFVIPPNKLINKQIIFKKRAIALVDGEQFDRKKKKHLVFAEVWYGEDDHERMNITPIVKHLWGKAHKRDVYNLLGN